MMESLSWVSPLFVPATRPDRFAKAAASGADAVIIDLEDAVAPENKEAARRCLVESELSPASIVVRINDARTPWYEADLAALASTSVRAVMLPKAEGQQDLAYIRTVLGPQTVLIPLIETAAGMANARVLATCQGVSQLAFGSIDYCADIQAAHTRMALLAARSELVLASRLCNRIGPLDGVTAQIDDPARSEEDARHARELGFSGKLCIHPSQIAPVQRGFTPTEAEISWAESILSTSDSGAVRVNGTMVDAPLRQRARAILSRAKK
jgi:citrate lyase subunit beta/citryl-CoA lyase